MQVEVLQDEEDLSIWIVKEPPNGVGGQSIGATNHPNHAAHPGLEAGVRR